MFNGLFTVIGVLGGWLLNNVREAIRDLQRQDALLTSELKTVEVSLARGYMPRQELHDQFSDISNKLDRIFEKIDKKADK